MSSKYTYQDIDANYINNKLVNWITGDKLAHISDNEKGYNKRYVYSKLENFLNSKSSTICAIYGLRRTGKSVLMRQAISSLIESGIDASKIAYVTFNKDTSYTDKDLIQKIRTLSNKVGYFFIDEISYIKFDIDNNSLNLLSDEFAIQGKKIVITGTFSYMIKLLSDDTLFDRIDKIDTTYMSFKEAHEILNMSIEDFIVYGGILEHTNRLTPEEYMKSAVTNNIINSLIRSEKIYEIGYTNKEIDGTIEDEKRLKIKLGILIRRVIDNKLGLANIPDISKECYDIFTDIFKQIGIIEDLFLKHCCESYFIINYIKYGLCTKKNNNQSDIDNLKASILKCTIYLDLKHSNKYSFDKYRNDETGYEVDLVLIDSYAIHLYEIKYPEHSLDEHARNIINNDFIVELEQVYHKRIASYNVLYRGNTLIKEVNPADVFNSLAESSIRANAKEKWTRLKDRATQFNWQSIQVNYINITEFLIRLK